MAAPYSYDLRSKAIEAVKRGERKTNVCRMLKISRNTLGSGKYVVKIYAY